MDFSWGLPKPSLPKINWTTSSFLGIEIPDFYITWEAKAMQQARLLTSPTIFGASGGRLYGGGEAGNELVVGQDYLLRMIREAAGMDNDGDRVMYATVPVYLDGREISTRTAELTIQTINRNQANQMRVYGR